ncbi:unnamed protein product [Schistosoma mattheei]|uniref:Uncharacterized protein n=1 Tax=Schistosoma mattheei TaxID=31246 RepID=A0A183Q2S7_9TREM|nr:unnamed protein product [Schistosoma mattheei]
MPSSSLNCLQTSSLSNVEQSDPTMVIGNDDENNVTHVRENPSSIVENHISAPDTVKSVSVSADVINDHNNSSSSSNGTNLSDDDSCADDDEDSENEHIHYGYNLLSSALSKIKRPFLQHYNTTTTTTHNPSSYHRTPYSHHSSIDVTRDSKHLLFSKSSRQSFDDNSSSINVMRQSAHHQNIMTNSPTTTTTTSVTTTNDHSNLTATLVDNNNNNVDSDDDVEDNDEDNEDANAQTKVSVVHNALNFFNRSTSDFINRINMNRSLLDWRSLIPSLSTNPTPQSGRRATTSNCFTGSNLTNQHGGCHVQPQNQYYPLPPQYQPQSERISRVSWSKPSCIEMKNTDSTCNQSSDNIPYTNTHKLSDSGYLVNPMNSKLLDMNYHYYDNYYINSNGNYQLTRQFPQVNNALNSVSSNHYECEYHSSGKTISITRLHC